MYLADLCCYLKVFVTNSWLNLTMSSSSIRVISVPEGFLCLMKSKKNLEDKSDEPGNLNIPEI